MSSEEDVSKTGRTPPANRERQRMHRVVIVGAGFGGLNAARALRRAPVETVVVDRRNFHLFQPLLYQVATGGLSPGDITSPIRHILRKQPHTRVLLTEVRGTDLAAHRLDTDSGPLAYDTLIVATGVHHHYFGHPSWETLAPGLKTIEDATELRHRMLASFEAAELVGDERHARNQWLTFVIVGAGPTGVELAGALAELARDTLPNDFRSIDPTSAKIILVEGADRVLPGYPEVLSARAARSLERLGVTLRLNTMVSGVDERGVTLTRDGRSEFLPTRCVQWAAGVQASDLGRQLAAESGAQLDRAGRVMVEPNLTLPGHPEVFVVGDLARVEEGDGKIVPGVAPAAMQEGRYVAKVVRARLGGRASPRPFRYLNKGSLATIGRKAAVADFGTLRFSGHLAWLLWLFVHLMYLVGFENRLLVFIKWAFSYFTRNRGARLITGKGPPLERGMQHQSEPS